jgi:hypothetical protein
VIIAVWPAAGQTDDAHQPAADRLLIPVDGAALPAEVAAVGVDQTITFRRDEQEQTVAWDDLVRWGSYRDACRGTQVVLADGSLLVAELLEIAQEAITVEGELCGRLQLPISRVRGVILDAPIDDLQRDRLLFSILAAEGAADRLLLSNGDTIQGVVQSIRDAAQATRPGELAIVLVSDGHPVEISLDKAVAVVFNPVLTTRIQPPERHLLMGFDDGSLLDVARIAAQGPFTRLTFSGGVELDVDPLLIQEELTYLLPRGPEVTYLSDLQPLSEQQVPWLERQWPVRRDRSATGGRLRSDADIALKGLGMHSAASAAYRLDGRYRRFDTELAIDARTGRQGSVVFRVFVYDAAGTRACAYESPIVRGGAAPLAVSVDVSGARALALVVDFSERGHVLDHANWLNARLVK